MPMYSTEEINQLVKKAEGPLSALGQAVPDFLVPGQSKNEKEWDEYKTSRSPVVRKLVKRREQDIYKGLIRGGLTASALGGGLLLGKRLMLSPEDEAKAQNFLNLDRLRAQMGESYAKNEPPNFSNAMRSLHEYSVLGSDAMGAKFFGKDPADVLKGVRSLPWLPKADRWNQGSIDHYDGFRKGPLHGFLREAEEQINEAWVPRKEQKWLGLFGVDQKGMNEFTRRAMNELVHKNTGQEGYFDSLSPLGYNDTTKPVLGRDKQIDILKQLTPFLEEKYGKKPGFQSFMPYTDAFKFHRHFKPMMTYSTGYAPEASTKKYREKLLAPPLAAWNAMGPLGTTALLGGGALGAYGAYRWLKSNRKKKKPEEEEE